MSESTAVFGGGNTQARTRTDKRHQARPAARPAIGKTAAVSVAKVSSSREQPTEKPKPRFEILTDRNLPADLRPSLSSKKVSEDELRIVIRGNSIAELKSELAKVYVIQAVKRLFGLNVRAWDTIDLAYYEDKLQTNVGVFRVYT